MSSLWLMAKADVSSLGMHKKRVQPLTLNWLTFGLFSKKISRIFLTTKVTRHFHKRTVAICQKTCVEYQSKKRANPRAIQQKNYRFFLRTPHQRPLTLNRKPKITCGLQITYNDWDEHLRLTSYIIMKLSAERSHLSRVLIKNVRCTNAFGRRLFSGTPPLLCRKLETTKLLASGYCGVNIDIVLHCHKLEKYTPKRHYKAGRFETNLRWKIIDILQAMKTWLIRTYLTWSTFERSSKQEKQ